jgi:type I restriction enzyme S subunit
MDLATFFEHFDTLAEAPNGIQRLRELILDMAVRGKLVPQDPEDEPTNQLLIKIEAEKTFLSKEKKIKTQKPLKKVDPENVPYQLPKGWEWVNLGEVGEFINGDRGKNYPNKNEYVAEGVPWINTGHIEPNGSLSQSRMNFIAREKFDSLRSGKIQPGDLVYCLRGATFGKTAIVDPYKEGAIASSLMIIRPFSICSNRYLYQYLMSPFGRSQIFRFDNGSAQPNLSANSVRLFLYPLPPLVEQKRIVAKVDELMALCDTLEAAQQTRNTLRQSLRASALDVLMTAPSDGALSTAWAFVRDNWDTMSDRPEDVEGLRQSVLQMAVEGRLGTQTSEDEDVSGLLVHIANTKKRLIKEGKLKNSKTKGNIEDENGLFRIPESWKWVKINDLYDVSGGIQKTPHRRPVNNCFPYLRVANVKRNSLDLEEIEYFELLDEELERWKLNQGDLLIVEGNGSAKEIGRCAVWRDEIENCVHQNHIIRARPIGHDGELFTLTFFNSPSGMTEMKRLAITTSGLYSLSVGKIREIVVPLPPLAEQKRIVVR